MRFNICFVMMLMCLLSSGCKDRAEVGETVPGKVRWVCKCGRWIETDVWMKDVDKNGALVLPDEAEDVSSGRLHVDPVGTSEHQKYVQRFLQAHTKTCSSEEDDVPGKVFLRAYFENDEEFKSLREADREKKLQQNNSGTPD